MSDTVRHNQKPGTVTAMAVITLLSGLVNTAWGLVLTANAVEAVLGFLCIPVTFLPVVLGVVEIVHSILLFKAQPQTFRPAKSIAVLEILTILFGNMFSTVAGILNLIFYHDLKVREYFSK